MRMYDVTVRSPSDILMLCSHSAFGTHDVHLHERR